MRILLVVNCHRREFPSRLHEVEKLAELRRHDEFVVVTTAIVAPTSCESAFKSPIEVVSVARFRNDSPATQIPQSGMSASHGPDYQSSLWRMFISDRHVSDLADIGSYATRAYSSLDLTDAFSAARTALEFAFESPRVDAVLPGAPDNYLSAMAIEMARAKAVPVAFCGGSEITGGGSQIVYNTIDLGNTRLTLCLAGKSDRTRSDHGQGDADHVAVAQRSRSIASVLRRDLKHLPFAVASTSPARVLDYGRVTASAMRSWAGSVRDTRDRLSSTEILLTTTEGTGREAVSRHAGWFGRRWRNQRDLANLAVGGVSELRGARRLVLVPLHFQPEAYVTFAAPELANQLVWVRLLSLALPPDAVLVVKEHPAQDPGWRPRDFYRQLAGIPRVILINPKVPTADLLSDQGVDMVCTIGGSMAIEARVAGVRVVSVLSSVSASFPGVIRLNPLSPDFASLVTSTLDSSTCSPSIQDVEKWYACIDRCVVPWGSFATMSASLIDWLERELSMPGRE